MSAPWLYARTRGASSLVGVLILVSLLAAMTPQGLERVPFRVLATTHLPPLVAAFPGLLLATSLRTPDPELETVAPRSVRVLRLWWLLGVLLVTSVVVAVALGGPFGLTEVVVRNHLGAAGIAAAAATFLPPPAAWLPTAAYLGSTWLYGTVDAVATPRWWALFVQPPGSGAALAIAAAIAVAGGSMWVWLGSRR
jgi:hypothetical protein